MVRLRDTKRVSLEEEEIFRYPGARPFEDNEYHPLLFYGREDEQKECTALFESSHFMLVTGRAAVGKTSFLRAGLFPQLRRKHYLPIYARPSDLVRGGLAGFVRTMFSGADALVDELKSKEGGNTLRAQLETIASHTAGSGQIPVLVIDQLEQIITQLRNKEGKRLLAELREVLRDGLAKLNPPGGVRAGDAKPTPPPFRLILATQDDFVDVLRGVEYELPLESLRNFQLKPLTRSQAERAIVKPGVLSLAGLSTAPLAFDRSVVDRLIELLTDYNRRSEIEPLHIQLLCRDIEDIIVLQNREGLIGDTPVVPAFLSSENGLDQVLRDFYERQVEGLKSFWFKSKARALCERGLISGSGEPTSLRAGSLSKKFGLSGEDVHRLLELRLVGLEGAKESYRCNLAHPSLVEPILHSRKSRLARTEGAFLRACLLLLVVCSTGLVGYKGVYLPWKESGELKELAAKQPQLDYGGTLGGTTPSVPGAGVPDATIPTVRTGGGGSDRAGVYETLGRSRDAARIYQNLLEQNPTHPFAARRLVAIFTDNGEAAAAQKLLADLREQLQGSLESARNTEAEPIYQLALARVLQDEARLEEENGNLPAAFNNWREAIKLMAQARKVAGAPPAILVEFVASNQALGELYYQQRAFEQAEESFTEVVLNAPDKTNGTLWRARARKAAGDLLGAVEDYNTIIRDHPDRASYYYERAETWFAMKDMAKALRDCFDANLRDSKNPLVYNLVGEAYLDLGDFKQAIEHFTYAINLDPRLFRAYQRRAEAYLRMEEYDRAVTEFTEMIRLQPHRHSAFGNRGLAYLKLGKLNEALADFSHVIQYYPEDALGYYNRANTYSRMEGRAAEALMDYDEALRINPDFARAYNNRGTIYLEQGEHQKALEDFTKAVEADPSYDFAYNNRGQTYRKLGDDDRGLENFDTAIRINPRNSEAFHNRGLYYYDAKEYPRALVDLNAALALEPENTRFLRTRALIHEKMGNPEEAEKDSSKADRIEREEPTVSSPPTPDRSELSSTGDLFR